MKKIVQVIATIVLIGCAGVLLFLGVAPRGTQDIAGFPPSSEPQSLIETAAAQDATRAPSSAPSFGFAVGDKRVVDLEAGEATLAQLSPRERVDQYRDWLLFTVVHAVQPSVEKFNDALFDLPTIRHAYLRPVGNYHFGETRSRLVDDGIVVALIPASAGATRKDYLAQVADEHRKNLGGMFKRLLVFEYIIDAEHGSAVLTRGADIVASKLFSPRYGYHEQRVASLTDLESFMASVDDVTAVTRSDNGLLLGGRKILGRNYRGISTEHVATVWQAEHKIQNVIDRWQHLADQEVDRFNASWRQRTYSGWAEKQRLEAEREAEWKRLNARLVQERRELHTPNGSGFSLDPTYDFTGLKVAFENLVRRMGAGQPGGGSPVSEHEATGILNALADDKLTDGERIVPLLRLIQRLGEDRSPGLIELSNLERDYRYQAARYDGDLQGTEVGMILFYTDLLAKLWTIDFVDSAPVQQVAGFITGTQVPLALIYKREAEELPSARLWFGHSNLGFQVADRGASVFLSRNATRVYAAGSNPLNPGVELQTSARFAIALDWWNEHYEEIARYEQEYERLNEIMKWSIVIGWLNEAKQGDKLDFLGNVTVDRSNTLPNWGERHRELRFQGWQEINFYPAGFKGSKTEALPMLRGPDYERYGESHYLSGGVSLAPKTIFKDRAPIASSQVTTRLRSNLDYAASASENTLKTRDATVFTISRTNTGRLSVVARAKPEAKLRGTTAQLANGEIERTTAANADTLRLETRVAGAPIGDLEINRTVNGFRVGWHARELDRAHSLARRLSTAKEPDAMLRADPSVEAIIKFPGEAQYAVRFSGPGQWVRLSPEEHPSADIANGWAMRVADFNGARRTMQLKLLDESQLRATVRQQGHLVFDPNSSDGQVVFQISSEDPPSGVRVVAIEGRDLSLRAWVNPKTRALHLVQPSDGIDPLVLARQLGPDEVSVIRTAAADKNRPPVARLPDAASLRARIIADLERGDSARAANDIVLDPVAARKAIDQRISAELGRDDAVASQNGPGGSIEHLDGLIRTYGPIPDLTLRRALRQIERGNVQGGVETAAIRPKRSLFDRLKFFDEINLRLSARGTEQENIYRLAQYADWRDQLYQHSGTRHDLGSLDPVTHNGRFDFDMRLPQLPEPQVAAVDPWSVANFHPIVYWQDSPGLNSIDWSAPVQQSLHQIVSGKLGTVIHLPRGDIAHFNPREIYTGDHAVHFNKASGSEGSGWHSSTNGHWYGPASGYQPCDLTTGVCPDDSTDDHRRDADNRELYFVIPN